MDWNSTRGRTAASAGLVALALTVGPTATAAWATDPSASTNPIPMIGIGDSIMHGDDAWGGLQQAIRSAGFAPVINAVSSRGLAGGDVHPDGLEVLQELSQMPAVTHGVKLYLNALGTNQYETNGSASEVDLQARNPPLGPVTFAQAVVITVNRERDMSPGAEILWVNVAIGPGRDGESQRNQVLNQLAQMMGFHVVNYAGRVVFPGADPANLGAAGPAQNLGGDAIHPSNFAPMNALVSEELTMARQRLEAADAARQPKPPAPKPAPQVSQTPPPSAPSPPSQTTAPASPEPSSGNNVVEERPAVLQEDTGVEVAQSTSAPAGNPAGNLPAAADPVPVVDAAPAVLSADTGVQVTATPAPPPVVAAPAAPPAESDNPLLPDPSSSEVPASATVDAGPATLPGDVGVVEAAPKPVAPHPVAPVAPPPAVFGRDCQLAGSTNKETIYRYLTCRGLTPEQAAGIMGNMFGESGYDPTSQEPMTHSDVPLASYPGLGHPPGYGLVGWTPGVELIPVADNNHMLPNSLEFQLKVLWAEVFEPGSSFIPAGINYGDLGARLKATTNVQQATELWEDEFERHYVDGTDKFPKHQPWRLQEAQNVLNEARAKGW